MSKKKQKQGDIGRWILPWLDIHQPKPSKTPDGFVWQPDEKTRQRVEKLKQEAHDRLFKK